MTSALIRVATIFILFDGIAVTDPASAMSGEHGQAAGAMVDVVTKSGTNGAGELQPAHVQRSHRPIRVHRARQRNGNPGGDHNRQRRPETQRTSTRSRSECSGSSASAAAWARAVFRAWGDLIDDVRTFNTSGNDTRSATDRGIRSSRFPSY
jgi:hypothetical protein